MPTDLPVRSDVRERSGDQAKSWRSILIFYGIAGIAVLLVMDIEARFGVFDGLSIPEATLQALGNSGTIDGIEPTWASRTAR
jgi:hypothetical protein